MAALLAGPADGDGTLLTADEAIEHGLADEVIDNKLAAAACTGADLYDLAGEDPEEDPEEKPEKEPEEPEKEPEEEPSDAPDGAMEGEPAEEPEKEPEAEPAEEPEKEPEEEPEEDPEEVLRKELDDLRAELAKLRGEHDKLVRNGLAPEAGTPAAPRSWKEALRICGGCYEEARRRFPRLYAALLREYNG